MSFEFILAFCEPYGRFARRSQGKAAELFASIGHLFGTVALGQYHHGRPLLLKEGHIGIDSSCGGGAERSRQGLGRSCIVDDVILDVIGQSLSLVQAILEL